MKLIKNNNDEEIKALVQESEEEYQNYQESENNDEYYSLNAEYSNNNEYFNNEDIRDRKIIKSDLQLSYNEYSNENIFNSKEEIEKINDDVEEIENVQEKIEEEEEVKENINMEIYNSYGIENNDEEKIKNIDTKRTEDVFAAFDKMLSSIISKAEEDARKSITKK